MTRGSEPARRAGGDTDGLLEWVALVRDLAERLTRVGDLSELGRAVSEEARRGLGACAVVLQELVEDGKALVAIVADGVTDETKALLAHPGPADETVPAIAALTKGGPYLWSTLAERDRDYPEYRGRPSAATSWAILPLSVRGAPVGALSLGWPQPEHFAQEKVAILEVIAHQCAIAIDREHLDQRRCAERETLELLSRGSELMVSALEPGRLVEALVQLAVPRLAPWCAVGEVEGTSVRRVAIAVDGAGELADALRGRIITSIDSTHPMALTVRTGELQIVHPIPVEVARTTVPTADAEVLEKGAAESTGICVPIKSGGAVIGVLSLASGAWKGTCPDPVRFAAEGLAARAGTGLANARLYQRERKTASMLAEAFLPARLPEIPGYELAARYLPSGSLVAGDWYDVAPLGSGTYLVGMGDAGGHGVEAASLMGQLRNGARSLAVIGRRPAGIVDGLRLLASQDSEDAFATVLYGLLDSRAHALHWTSAGHVPLLRFGSGGAAYLPEPPDLPLGCPAGPAAEHVLELGRGDGVVLVTDGVAERRADGLESRMQQLLELVAARTEEPASTLTEAIVEALCAAPEDDCCVLVLKRT